MTNQERMALLMQVFNAIFTSKAQGTDITTVVIQSPHIVQTQWNKGQGRWFVKGQLRGFDLDLNLGDRVIQIRCIEQNPFKTDHLGNLKPFSLLAQQGHKIMWVINRNGDFMGRIQGGQWYASQDRATSPVKAAYDYNTPEHEAKIDAAYDHINRDINDPNFHGIPGTSQPYEQNTGPASHDQLVSELPDIETGIPEYVLAYYAEHGDAEVPE